jgi:seryl-tRNA synthetase
VCQKNDLQAVWHECQDALVHAGLLVRSGVPGVYGLSGTFHEVIERFDRYLTRIGNRERPEVLRFPPLLARASYEKTDHLETFPNLMGSVHSFLGSDKDHLELSRMRASGEDWTRALGATATMMTPAVCYPLYPTATGTLPAGGRLFDLRGFVFRHEPSPDPARMQAFQMREYVRLGTPSEALEHRDAWLKRAEEILRAVGLDATPVVANDPFFGRGGRVMAASQREQALKFELVVPITSAEKPTAVASVNYHLDHFATPFAIKTAGGATAHSSCVGFGLERVALALFKTHGFDPAKWPAEVRSVLA